MTEAEEQRLREWILEWPDLEDQYTNVVKERDDLKEALQVLGLLQRETQRERDEARNVARSYRRRWLTASGTTPQEDLPENLRWLNANILGVIGD